MTSCTALKRGNIARSSGDGRRSLVVSFARDALLFNAFSFQLLANSVPKLDIVSVQGEGTEQQLAC